MTPSLGTYGFINAKVRAMRSFLLTEAVYRSLLAAASDQEMINVLQQTHYAPLADRLRQEDQQRTEDLLIEEEIHRLQKIRKNSKGVVSKTVSLFLDRYENERLKTLLRMRKAERSVYDSYTKEKIQYDIIPDAIRNARTYSEVVDLLEGTPFRRVIADLSKDAEQDPSGFQVELALDRDLYRRSWEAVNLLSATDRSLAKRLLGLEIDLKNIDWIHRFMKYYGLTQEKVINMLLPHGQRLNASALRRIASGERFEGLLGDIVKRVGPPSSDRPAQDEKDGGASGTAGLAAFERFLFRALYEEAKRVYAKTPFSIGVVYGYFYLIRVETKNVRTILQGKAYGVPDEEIQTLLVM